MCIDIVEIWLGIANGQVSSNSDSYLPVKHRYFHFLEIANSKYQWIFTKLGMCIDFMAIMFRIANGQISSIFDGYLPTSHLYCSLRTIT